MPDKTSNRSVNTMHVANKPGLYTGSFEKVTDNVTKSMESDIIKPRKGSGGPNTMNASSSSMPSMKPSMDGVGKYPITPRRPQGGGANSMNYKGRK